MLTDVMYYTCILYCSLSHSLTLPIPLPPLTPSSFSLSPRPSLNAQVSACVTHALFSGPALERIGKSVMQHVIVSDTIPIRHDYAAGSAAEKVGERARKGVGGREREGDREREGGGEGEGEHAQIDLDWMCHVL